MNLSIRIVFVFANEVTINENRRIKCTQTLHDVKESIRIREERCITFRPMYLLSKSKHTYERLQ